MNNFIILYLGRIFNRKNMLLVILLFFLIEIFLAPIKNFSIMTKYPVSPCILPFLLTDTNFLILFMATVICFFSNVPFMRHCDCYYLLRGGKKKWIKEQMVYIVMSAFLITSASIILTWISLFPQLKMERGWGNIIYTLSQTNAGELCNLFWQISAQFISKHSAFRSMVMCVVITTLGIIFVGMLMFCCSCFFSRTLSVVIAIVVVVYSHMVTAMGDFMQKKLAMISPISWMRIADLDVIRYGCKIAPSVFYVVCSYILLISVLIYLIWCKLNKMDFVWHDEEE